MGRTIVSVSVLLAMMVIGGFGSASLGQPAKGVKAPKLPDKGRWHLLRDFKLDGELKAPQETIIHLTSQGRRLSGTYARKVGDPSHFSGEIVTREKTLLILRQEHVDDGETYVVMHAGHAVGAHHYRGSWYDNAGNSGDFELKLGK